MSSLLTPTRQEFSQMAGLKVVTTLVTLGADASAADYIETGLTDVMFAAANVITASHVPAALKCEWSATYKGRIYIRGVNATTNNSLAVAVVAMGY